MIRQDLAELSAFATVAEERSFTRAASRLGVSQSALSHSIRGLEKKNGSSAPSAYYAQCLCHRSRYSSPSGTCPTLERIEKAIAATMQQRNVLRVVSGSSSHVVRLRWFFFRNSAFAFAYPEIILEMTSSNDPVNLVAGQYDAGVQLGKFIQRDMIAVQVTKEMCLTVVGSPKYFEADPMPRQLQDLKDHSCIGFRFSNGLYRWEFEKGRKALTVNPQGPASFDDPDLVIRAVLDGVGVGTAMEASLAGLLAERRLLQVLEDWCPSFPGYFLYYPSRGSQPGALAAPPAERRTSKWCG